MSRLALLHTSPVHIPVFDALRDEDHPALELRQLLEREHAGCVLEPQPSAICVLTNFVSVDELADAALTPTSIRPAATVATRVVRNGRPLQGPLLWSTVPLPRLAL